MKTSPAFSFSCILVASFFLCAPEAIVIAGAQQMHEAKPAVASSYLELVSQTGTRLRMTPADFKALPHRTITVTNEHTKQNETYVGVPVAELLAKVEAPLGEKLRGKFLLGSVIATGTDGYAVLYSLAEVDPSMHTGDVIVADSENGAPLQADGAFKLISSEDKRPARWVRNLQSLSVSAGDAH